ncbi:hypothetical protein BH24ACT12_BH24ACT12_18330 [soil metagenome]
MDLQLLAALVIGIASILVIVLFTRLDAFVGLLMAAIITGSIAGSSATTLASITTGFGTTLGAIGIVIGLGVGVGVGVGVGKILEVSGAADALARAFVRALGKGRESWAMGGTGALVSIPVFCDSGYVIMKPAGPLDRPPQARRLRHAGTRARLRHDADPPPGAADTGPAGRRRDPRCDPGWADPGRARLLGAPAADRDPVRDLDGSKLEDEVSPEIREAVYGTVSVGGHGTATASAGSGAGTGTGTGTDPVREDQPEERDPAEALGPPPADEPPHRVSAWMASLPLLVPLLLIVLNTAATAIERNSQGALGPEDPYEPSTLVAALAFVGNPVVALLIGIVLAVYGLLPRWVSKTQVGGWLSEAAASAGLIILITAQVVHSVRCCVTPASETSSPRRSRRSACRGSWCRSPSPR